MLKIKATTGLSLQDNPYYTRLFYCLYNIIDDCSYKVLRNHCSKTTDVTQQ